MSNDDPCNGCVAMESVQEKSSDLDPDLEKADVGVLEPSVVAMC